MSDYLQAMRWSRNGWRLGALVLAASLLWVMWEIRDWKPERPSSQQSGLAAQPLYMLLEPVQAEAHRRGDNYTAAAINYLQVAIVEGKQREFVLKIK